MRRPHACDPSPPRALAHDAFTRLLTRIEPDPEELWRESEPLVARGQGVLVLDDSTRDKPYDQKLDLVTTHWSGKHKEVVRGINRIILLWTDGDHKLPVDYRIFSKADGNQDRARPRLGNAPARQGPRVHPGVRALRHLVRQSRESASRSRTTTGS